MNKIVLSGNLVKDSELKFLPGGETAVANFTIANNEGYGDKKQVTFLNCVLFGKRAESLNNYLTKGTKVIIDGKLRIRDYEDKEKNKRYITEIIVNELELLGNRQEKEQGQIQSSDLTETTDDIPF